MRCDIEEEPVALEMTPIIDCVFLLLIFFLVATTMKKIDHELPINLPDESFRTLVAVQQPDEFHAIGIDAEGNYYFDGRAVGQGALQDEMRALAFADPAAKVRLDVDRDARFNDVMLVLDLLRFERLEHVGLNTRPPER